MPRSSRRTKSGSHSKPPRPSGPKLPLQLRPQPLPAPAPPGITALVPGSGALYSCRSRATLGPLLGGFLASFQSQLSFFSKPTSKVLSCRQNLSHSPRPPNVPFSLLFSSAALKVQGGSAPQGGRHHEWFLSNDPELGLVSEGRG